MVICGLGGGARRFACDLEFACLYTKAKQTRIVKFAVVSAESRTQGARGVRADLERMVRWMVVKGKKR